MFSIPETEIHDRVIIISVLFPREAEASRTAGNLLHFQIASPASPLETNCPFPVSDMPLDPQARGCPKRKQGASPWLTCSQTSFIHLSPPAGRERGCASSPPAQARAVQDLKALWAPRAGLAAARASHRHGVGGLCQHTQCLSQPCWSRQHQVCCWTRPGAALTHYSRSRDPSPWVSRWQGSQRGSLLCIFHPRAALAVGRGWAHSAAPLFQDSLTNPFG